MKEVLQQMQNEKGQPCLSIILPTHKLSPERALNNNIIREGLAQAKSLLDTSQNWPREIITKLSVKLDDLMDQINPNSLKEGLGLFISPGFSSTLSFTFPVKEKIILADSFETRDVGYLCQLMHEYYLLLLSKKEIQFFKSDGETLEEIHNEDFPMTYEIQYEYARPVRGLSYGSMVKTYEQDKSIDEEFRQLTFLKTADEKLRNYLDAGDWLLINGVTEEIANFEKLTVHKLNIVGKIKGNLSHTIPVLQDKAIEKITEYRNKKNEKLLFEIRESVGKNRAAVGLQEVWKNVWEGKGLTMAVDRGFYHSGYTLPDSEYLLHLMPPLGNYQIINDAIDDVIEMMIRKNGEVIFYDSHELDDLGRIALLLRY